MNTKLRCLLLDDELPGLSYLKLLCEQIDGIEVVKAFNDSEKFLNELPGLEFDLCILDIEMPGTNGIAIAKLIQGKPVIFTTAYKTFAAEAFDIDAIDYIVKPIELERLQKAVNKVIQRNDSGIAPAKQIKINSDKGIALIDSAKLAYIRTSEIDSRDKAAHLVDGTTIRLKNISFEKLSSLLPNESFCRINKKEIISLSSVHYYSQDQITTNIYSNSNKPLVLHLGEAYRQSFMLKMKG